MYNLQFYEDSWNIDKNIVCSKIAKKIEFFAIAIVLWSFEQMAIADRDLDREKMIAIAIDDQNIYLAFSNFSKKKIAIRTGKGLQIIYLQKII